MSDLFNIPNILDDDPTAHAVGDMAQAMLLKLSPVDHGTITYCLLELYYFLAVSTVHPARSLNENGKTVFAALGGIFNRAGISISLTSNASYEL